MKIIVVFAVSILTCLAPLYAQKNQLIDNLKNTHSYHSIAFHKTAKKQLPQYSETHFWNNTERVWVLIRTETFTYSADGNQIENLKDSTIKIINIENRNARESKIYSFERNQAGNGWDSLEIVTNYYDAHENDTLVTFRVFDKVNQVWTRPGDFRYQYTYNGNQISSVVKSNITYNGSTAQYTIKDKYEYIYDTLNVLTGYVISNWDNVTQRLKLQYQFTDITWLEWNGSNNNSLMTSWKFKIDSSGFFVDEGRSNLFYNSHKDLVQEVQEELQNASNWVLSYKDSNEITYDVDDNMTQKIESIFNIPKNEYLNKYKTIYSDFFIPTPTGLTRTLVEMNVEVYPNPSFGKFNIGISLGKKGTLSVFDHSGKLVHQQELTTENTIIELEGSGLYFYQIKTDDGESKGGKIIVE